MKNFLLLSLLSLNAFADIPCVEKDASVYAGTTVLYEQFSNLEYHVKEEGRSIAESCKDENFRDNWSNRFDNYREILQKARKQVKERGSFRTGTFYADREHLAAEITDKEICQALEVAIEERKNCFFTGEILRSLAEDKVYDADPEILCLKYLPHYLGRRKCHDLE